MGQRRRKCWRFWEKCKLKNQEEILKQLKNYDGPPLKIMEVCGTHTAALFRHGIHSLLSPKIQLISGPGCPVCVTPTQYIDRLVEISLTPHHQVWTFGDMMKVPGEEESLSQAMGRGAQVHMMYSPFQVLEAALANPDITYVLAAVGFETTTPLYAQILKEAREKGLKNIQLLTSLKQILPAMEWILSHRNTIDGFLCPGHVSTIIGWKAYQPLAETYKKPMVVAGFTGTHLLKAIHRILEHGGEGKVFNDYPGVVSEEGNLLAKQLMEEVFQPEEAVWRGLGAIVDSGWYLKGPFAVYDMGSYDLRKDKKLPPGCLCREVIIGDNTPAECPMFGTECSPNHPYGPCMVSEEGACGIWYGRISI